MQEGQRDEREPEQDVRGAEPRQSGPEQRTAAHHERQRGVTRDVVPAIGGFVIGFAQRRQGDRSQLFVPGEHVPPAEGQLERNELTDGLCRAPREGT